jgi:Fuc2NAc and GlcNAc transferase
MLPYLYLFAVFTVSGVLTGIFHSFALKKDLLDIPNERSSHTSPVPHGGGLAIVLTLLTSLLILYLSGRLPSEVFWALSIGGGGVAFIGFIDDRSHVPARWRLLVHFLAAGFSLYLLSRLPGVSLAGLSLIVKSIGFVVALVFMVWVLNLFNFMDGIDGIASVEAISVSLGAALIIFTGKGSSSEIYLLLLVAGSCLGFLLWNWPPAKIFMGDVGSGFLGFVLAALAFYTSAAGLISPWSWLVLGGVFLVDSTATLLSRVVKREQWYEAHCSHAYQCAARHFASHKAITLGVLSINVLWLLPLAWLANSGPGAGWLLMLVAYLPLLYIVIKFRTLKQT